MVATANFLLEGLSGAQIERIKSVAEEISLEKGDHVVTEGEEALSAYILEAGAIELTTFVEEGFDLPIAILRNQGEVFGSAALLPPYQYSLSARCAEKSTLLRLDGTALKQIMSEDSDLGCKIMTNLARYFFERLKETRLELKIHFKTLLNSTRS
jgi:CRP-like cAMP-binding protein